MTETSTSQTKAFRLLKGIYDRTRDKASPIFVAELAAEVGLTKSESEAAWRYLRDRRLIETFNLDYTARINATGIDAIEQAKSHPDRPIRAFPSVTHNIVNNTTNIGTAINSPIQQAGAQSTQNQIVSYSVQECTDLARLVSEFTGHLDELHLDPTSIRKVKAQLATLEAQLKDEPDPVIIRQAGRTLRNITEGAIAGLIAAAVQPTVWVLVSEIMNRLFR
jgi:hypothetical protein